MERVAERVFELKREIREKKELRKRLLARIVRRERKNKPVSETLVQCVSEINEVIDLLRRQKDAAELIGVRMESRPKMDTITLEDICALAGEK